jgi:hypothetical protein
MPEKRIKIAKTEPPPANANMQFLTIQKNMSWVNWKLNILSIKLHNYWAVTRTKLDIQQKKSDALVGRVNTFIILHTK